MMQFPKYQICWRAACQTSNRRIQATDRVSFGVALYLLRSPLFSAPAMKPTNLSHKSFRQFINLSAGAARGRHNSHPYKRRMSCCAKTVSESGTSSANGLAVLNESKTFDLVQDYYGKVLSTTKDLKTSACTSAGAPHPLLVEMMKKIPKEIMAKFYGCGAPLPLGINGLRVLDLGSGSGRDCYLSAALVGEEGSVTGVDMTDEQLDVARKYTDEYTATLGYQKPNLAFVKGHIEYLDKAGIADESQDIVISNCVVNLSPDKPRVLREAYRVLAPGGEFYFSDVYCDRRLPEEARQNEVLWGECISGALYNEDFKRIARDVGFTDPRILNSGEIVIKDRELKAVVGDAKFYSITYRLFKVPGKMETLCEDYGQVAIYKGTIPGHEHAYELDDHHRFVKNKPMLVCGNTAAMVGEEGISWLSPHFEVMGNRDVHYGLFDCSTGPSASTAPTAVENADCTTSSCC